MELKTERLILRDFKPEDFEAFYATTNDPEYRQYYARQEMARDFWVKIFNHIRAPIDKPARDSFQLAISLQTGELIGTCGVRTEDRQQKQASFGCAIARPFWGKGYAYEASYRIIDFGFSSLPIHRVYAETISENKRSRALAERLGMTFEGELRHTKFFQERWWNTVIYSVLENEWKS